MRFQIDKDISRTLDSIIGGNPFSTAEMPWVTLILIALLLTWGMWITSKVLDR